MPNKFETWFASFVKGKKEVTSFDQSSTYAIHTIRRFIEDDHHLWEIAFTYTGRLVVRSGPIEPDGVTVKWSEWITQHDVQLPRGGG